MPAFPSKMTCALILMAMCLVGCGTTKNQTATEQLLLSDAVDVAVARIDFTPLAGQRVYLDSSFIKDYKGVGFVNSNYIISSLRQQLTACGVLLLEKEDEADFIVEARVGVLGSDAHEVSFGIPSTAPLSAVTSAVSAMAQVPAIPGIPELSVARRKEDMAAAKVIAYCYDRESRERIWQSGISVGHSDSKDIWFFGAGPFHKGAIHNGEVKFAGSGVDVPLLSGKEINPVMASYRYEALYKHPKEKIEEKRLAEEEARKQSEIQQASAEEKAEE